MSLAFQSIYPEVYPVAYKLFEKGDERYWVAAKIFKEFGHRYGVPDSEVDTAVIDLSITCAENDYKNKLEKHSSGKTWEDNHIKKLLKLD